MNYENKRRSGLIEQGILNSLRNLNNINKNDDIKSAVMIYGYGELGQKALESILKKDDLLQYIKKVYVVTREKNKDASKDASITNTFKQFKGIPVDLEHISISDAYDAICEVDMCLVTASKDRKVDGRINKTKENLPIILDDKNGIDRLFERSYDGHVHIVSNLPEILTYALLNSSRSRLEPFQISGHSHVDKIRLDICLRSMYKEQFENLGNLESFDGFCIGSHDEPWIVLNGSLAKFEKGYISGNEILGLSELLSKNVGNYGKELLNLIREAKLDRAPSSEQTSIAIAEFLLGYYTDCTKILNASVYHEGLYLSLPTLFEDKIARPNKELFSKLTDVDHIKLTNIRDRLKEEIENIGITGRQITPLKNAYGECPISKVDDELNVGGHTKYKRKDNDDKKPKIDLETALTMNLDNVILSMDSSEPFLFSSNRVKNSLKPRRIASYRLFMEKQDVDMVAGKRKEKIDYHEEIKRTEVICVDSSENTLVGLSRRIRAKGSIEYQFFAFNETTGKKEMPLGILNGDIGENDWDSKFSIKNLIYSKKEIVFGANSSEGAYVASYNLASGKINRLFSTEKVPFVLAREGNDIITYQDGLGFFKKDRRIIEFQGEKDSNPIFCKENKLLFLNANNHINIFGLDGTIFESVGTFYKINDVYSRDGIVNLITGIDKNNGIEILSYSYKNGLLNEESFFEIGEEWAREISKVMIGSPNLFYIAKEALISQNIDDGLSQKRIELNAVYHIDKTYSEPKKIGLNNMKLDHMRIL